MSFGLALAATAEAEPEFVELGKLLVDRLELLADATADTALAAEVGIVVAGFAVVFVVVAGESTAGLSESMSVDWPGSRLFVVGRFEIVCSLRLLP